MMMRSQAPSRLAGALALALAAVACERSPALEVELPGTLRLAELSEDERARLEAVLVLDGVLGETPLKLSDDLKRASGELVLPNVTSDVVTRFAVDLRFKPRPGQGEAPLLLARAEGEMELAAHTENALSFREDHFESCGELYADGPCALLFDHNRNGRSNLEDLHAGIDPFLPPPFLDAAPSTLQFPSGVRLGSFARQVVVVENASATPVEVRASLVGAPGVTLSRYEPVIDAADGARRSLELGVVQPYQEAFLAISFAPVNPYLTTGDVFLEAYDPVSGVRQATRVKVIANADGELRPPLPSYRIDELREGADLGGYGGEVARFSTAELFSGLPVTGVPSGEGVTNGLRHTGRKLLVHVEPDQDREELPADAVFLVEVPPRNRLSVSLAGLARDVDLAVLELDDADNLQADPAKNHRPKKSGTSPEAVELRNTGLAPKRVLLVLGRMELAPPAVVPGALSAAELTPFDLQVTLSSAPEFTAPLAPLAGPIEGGNRVILTGRGFHPNAAVTFADARALDCAHEELEDHGTRLTCTAPPGSLLVGKNPATVVVANPSVDEGGDGQAATFPEGYVYHPPAPRLDELSPKVASTEGSTTPLTLKGAFFSTRHGPPVVRFGQSEATVVTLVDASRLEVLAPAHPAGVVSVTVQNRLGVDHEGAPLFSLPSNARSFSYIVPAGPPPMLEGVSPSSGSVDGGELVVVTGGAFTPGAQVTFDGQLASSVTFIDDTELRVRTPPRGTPGFVDVEVVNEDGQTARRQGFYQYFIPDPTVLSAFPSEASTAGGTFIVVGGTGFRAGVQVLFTAPSGFAVPSPNVNRVSASTLLVATPAVLDGGDYQLTVLNPEGQSASYAGSFRFVAPQGPPPRIDSLDPSSGFKEQPTLVTVRGTDFRGPPAILIGSQSAALVSFVDNEPPLQDELTFHAPVADDDGPVTVRLINDDGQSDTGVFTYFTDHEAPPQIHQLSPSQVPPSGGAEVTLQGAAFKSAARLLLGGVELGGATNDPTITPTRITFVAPARPEGSYTLSIENPDGQAAHTSLRYQQPALVEPMVGVLLPERVHAFVPGDALSITGQHLSRITTIMLQRAGGGGVVDELPILTKSDVLLTTSMEYALEPSEGPGGGLYELALWVDDEFPLASPPFSAVAPTVLFSSQEGPGGALLLLGDMLNPTKLLAARLEDADARAPTVTLDITSKSETFVHVAPQSVLLPGVPYQLVFDYQGASDVVPARTGPAPLGPPPLRVSIPPSANWLPANTSLAGRSLRAYVPGLSAYRSADLGTPSSWSFFLEPEQGQGIGPTGFFSWNEGEDEVTLHFETGSASEGRYRVVLATENTNNLARTPEGGLLEVSGPRLEAIDPGPTVTRQAVVALHGRFSAGDQIVMAPFEGVKWTTNISGHYDRGDEEEPRPYYWALPYLAGEYFVCVLPPGAPNHCPPELGLPLMIQPHPCAPLITPVGLGGQFSVTLEEELGGCFTSGSAGAILSLDVPSSMTGRARVLSPNPPPPQLHFALAQTCDGSGGSCQSASQEFMFQLERPGQQLFVGGEGLGGATLVIEVALFDDEEQCLRPDEDGDGYDICSGDCSEGNGDVSPGAPEVCNGVDDNCDGIIDNAPGCDTPDAGPNDGGFVDSGPSGPVCGDAVCEGYENSINCPQDCSPGPGNDGGIPP